MRLTLTKPGSVSYERVRWLIALWGRPGAAFLGGKTQSNPPATCNLLLLDGDTFGLLDGEDLALLGCDMPPAACDLLLLDGDTFGLLDGDNFELLG